MTQHVLGIKDLMAVGAHFGHSTQRRNPKMKPYIYGTRAKVHIINLTKTLPMLITALNHIENVVAKGGRVLFVGTKRQAAKAVKDEAERCGQHYVNARWLGGTLTNWPTISNSIDRMKKLEEQFESEAFAQLTKKEQLQLYRAHEKLIRSLGGIRHMGDTPTILFVTDTNKEHISLAEAKKLGIETVALVDTNSDPSHITFPIPSNDDALRALQFYCHMVAEAVLKGLEREAARSGNAVKRSKKEDAPAKAEATTQPTDATPSESEASKPSAEQPEDTESAKISGNAEAKVAADAPQTKPAKPEAEVAKTVAAESEPTEAASTATPAKEPTKEAVK